MTYWLKVFRTSWSDNVQESGSSFERCPTAAFCNRTLGLPGLCVSRTVVWDRNSISPQGLQDVAAALEKWVKWSSCPVSSKLWLCPAVNEYLLSRQELHHPIYARPHHGCCPGPEGPPREDRGCFTQGSFPVFIKTENRWLSSFGCLQVVLQLH